MEPENAAGVRRATAESHVLRPWAPVATVERDTVTVRSIAALDDLFDCGGALLDRHTSGPEGGTAPPLAHWFAFFPRSPQRELGPDGHPRRGGFLPPIALPRRMFVGARLRFLGDVPLDVPLERRGVVTSVVDKVGRSGPLIFVTARFEVTAASHPSADEPAVPLVTEEQDVVYRAAPQTAAETRLGEPDVSAPSASSWPWRWDLPIDATMLFRFSALTYNAHRIHYDREFAVGVEGYPGLVVHGPLQAAALLELCRRHAPEARVAALSFAAVHPAFDGGAILLRGRPGDDGSVELAVFDARGVRTMAATATLDGAAR